MAKRRGKPPRIPQLGNHGLDDALHAYATSMSSPEPAGLESLRRATWTQTVKPQMLCDELQGRLLASLSCMIAPTRVLELGTSLDMPPHAGQKVSQREVSLTPSM